MQMFFTTAGMICRDAPQKNEPPFGGSCCCDFGGAERDRTDDLLSAIQALSQLSYSPTFDWKYSP